MMGRSQPSKDVQRPPGRIITMHVQDEEGGQCVQSRLRMEKGGGQRLGHGGPCHHSGFSATYNKEASKDLNQEYKII